MNIRLILKSSLLVNGALAAAVLFAANRRSNPAALAPSVPKMDSSTNVGSFSSEIPAPAPSVGDSDLPFLWTDLLSEDLERYRDNLRALGCPEATVRDILLGEINTRFGLRRQSLLTAWHGILWEAAHAGTVTARMIGRTEAGRQFSALAEERQGVIEQLLGPDPEQARAAILAREEDFALEHAWLPESKRDILASLEQRRLQQVDAWSRSGSLRDDPGFIPEDVTRLQSIQDEYQQALKDALSPEEFHELELRDSPHADWALTVPGLEVSEDEWRGMTRALMEFDAAQAALDAESLDLAARDLRQEALHTALDQTAASILQPEHYRLYALTIRPGPLPSELPSK